MTDSLTMTASLQAQTISCLAWSTKESTLAAATHQGSLVLFMVGLRKREVFPGKHSKAILCMAWSATGLLAMAGRDNKVIIASDNPIFLICWTEWCYRNLALLFSVPPSPAKVCHNLEALVLMEWLMPIQVSILWGTDGSLLRMVTLRKEVVDLQFAPSLPGVTSTSEDVMAGKLGRRSIILAEVRGASEGFK